MDTLAPETLIQLIDGYHVRTHDGKTYDEVGGDPHTFILNWLKDDARPIREAWGYPPEDLVEGYLNASDRNDYFQQFTGISGEKNFLNDTERLFFLTHGYGRPNEDISVADLKARQIYIQAPPTALIALSDILGVCPTNQDPDFIREKLSELKLIGIDSFHETVVVKITECLRNCKPCSTEAIECFREFLRSIGVLDVITYNPTTNVFESNISQLSLYKSVIPDKHWSLQEILGMPDVYVKSTLEELSDQQLITIEAPHVGPFQPDLPTLRSRLIQEAMNFLTQKRYFFLGNGQVGFGRPIDEELQQMALEELFESFQTHEAFIDPYGNPVGDDDIKLLMNFESEQLLEKRNARVLKNIQLISALDPEKRGDIVKKLQEENLPLTQLQEVFTDESGELILWAKQNQEWIPINIDWNTYFELWSPRYSKIIRDSIEYYTSGLNF